MTSQEHIDFFWRPGCGFCMSLEHKLSKAHIALRKHNIWEDEANAEFVRSVANGSETVPTVRIGAMALVNPSVGEVLEAIRREAPHLVPAES